MEAAMEGQVQTQPPVQETDRPSQARYRGLGLRHALFVVTAPVSVFRRVEDTGAYGWALLTLLVLVTLIGVAQIQTGLIDRDVTRQTELTKAKAEKTLGSLVDRARHRERMEEIDKSGRFNMLMMRLGAVVMGPAYFLVSFLLIASALYACVALTGRKPEYHTLMSICVYAGFIELIGVGLTLGMMLYYRTTGVDTSLAGLGSPGEPTVWAAIDPFRIWFWVLVAIGLTVTRQLSRRAAIVSCSLLALLSIGARIGIEFASNA